MLNSLIFDSVFTSTTLTGQDFLLATLCSVVCGLVIALLYKIKNKPSRSFLVTLVVLPAAVQMVIMLVNGNLGAGVAVAGAFSLVRFRSVPGKGHFPHQRGCRRAGRGDKRPDREAREARPW